MKSSNKKHQIKVKLIFNPKSGSNKESPVQLMDIIKELQAWDFLTEPFLINSDCDLNKVLIEAIAQGINMFVICGGDGTISAVTKELMGKNVTIGIIPTGTQNNIALSLNIPTNIPDAIAILRTGQHLKIDMGIVTCGEIRTPFTEICSAGLFSTLFPAVDEIQHGNLARVGDFLATLTTSSPSEIHLVLDDKQELIELAHVVLISNMPYIGRHFQVSDLNSFQDGLLDVIIYSDLSKIELIDHAFIGTGSRNLEDPRIQHFAVHKATIDTNPSMSIMADGITIGEGMIKIEVQKKALDVMVGTIPSNEIEITGENIEK